MGELVSQQSWDDGSKVYKGHQPPPAGDDGGLQAETNTTKSDLPSCPVDTVNQFLGTTISQDLNVSFLIHAAQKRMNKVTDALRFLSLDI